jgi:hypothetical protein
MSRELTLERLYSPDSVELGTLAAGLSGSGKTTALITTLQQAIKSPSFGEFHRFIIIDPKTQAGDYDLLTDPISDLGKFTKSVQRERVSLLWVDVEELEAAVDYVVNLMFNISDSNPETSFTFVLDEASILITPSRIPPALKRVSVQGRAKRIKPVFVSQRPIINRWTDANLSNLLLFRTLPVDADTLGKRWGIDFTKSDEVLREKPFSFLWFDLNNASIHPMNPLPLPKPRPKKPTRREKAASAVRGLFENLRF